MTYARARLWTAACAVGLLVVFSLIAWMWQLPATLFPFDGGPVVAEWAAFVTLYAIYTLLMSPFDLLGGYWLPAQHQRQFQSFPLFLKRWLRGVAAQGLVMTLSALMLFLIGRHSGVWAATGALLVLHVVLLTFALPLARFVGGLQTVGPLPDAMHPRTVVVAAFDPGFAGGFTGLPGRETVVVPILWTRQLSPDHLKALLLRRNGVLASGLRLRGVLLAMAWNAAGFVLCAHLPGAGVERIWEFVTTLIAFTLWSFLGLLILPSFSRAGVMEADRYALEHGASRETLREAIEAVARWQDDEPSRGPWTERIFHPIPSVENRVVALASDHRPYGAWHAGRTALYLSWANFGLLARAVHSNAGRPELWVLFPCD